MCNRNAKIRKYRTWLPTTCYPCAVRPSRWSSAIIETNLRYTTVETLIPLTKAERRFGETSKLLFHITGTIGLANRDGKPACSGARLRYRCRAWSTIAPSATAHHPRIQRPQKAIQEVLTTRHHKLMLQLAFYFYRLYVRYY